MKTRLKRVLVKAHWILVTQIGIDPIRMITFVIRFPAFLVEYWQFKREFSGNVRLVPSLHDRTQEGGSTKGEYFLQDLFVARKIFLANPEKHLDVGSRVDGFVAHVASFRELEVVDVRPISSEIPGIKFVQADLSNADSMSAFHTGDGYCDSLSCLHALEHFGLGRYGDALDVSGFSKGLQNLAKLLKPAGVLYLSTPVGKERVEFNANWVFHPNTIIEEAQLNGLSLASCSVLNPSAESIVTLSDEESIKALGEQEYCLAIFELRKNQ